MDLLLGLGLLALLAVPLGWALSRATTLFSLRIRDGRVELATGRVPPRLLHDIEDVFARSRAKSASVRVVSEGGRPRVVGSGLSEDTLQRLRNVVGHWSLAQIRAGRKRA